MTDERMAELLAKLARYQRVGSTCWYCGDTIGAVDFITEHVTPRSRGGGDGSNNLVTGCQRCNTRKSCRTLEEYRRLLADRNGVAPELIVFYGETPEGADLAPNLAPDPVKVGL